MNDKANRALVRVVRKRLDTGQSATDIGRELRARLSDEQTEAVIAAAQAGRTNGPLFTGKGRWGVALAAILWVAALIFQNVAVLVAASEGPGNPMDYMGSLVIVSAAKICLLLGAAAMFVWSRASLRYLVLAAVVLYAFPLGVFVDYVLFFDKAVIDRPSAWTLLSTGALISYAIVAMLLFAWSANRRRAAALSLSR